MRLFIATPLDDGVRKEIGRAAALLAGEIKSGIKWANPRDAHITYYFLGEVGSERLKKLEGIVDSLEFERFTACLSGFGAFPGLSRPRVLWMGVEKGREKLKEIAGELHSKLSEAGFMLDNRFEPHVTLGRVKGAKFDCEKIFGRIEFAPVPFEARECVLVQSRLTSLGPEHSVLRKKVFL